MQVPTPGRDKLSTAQLVVINTFIMLAVGVVFLALVTALSLGQTFGFLPSHDPVPSLDDPAVAARRDDALLEIREDFDGISSMAQLRYGGGGTQSRCDSGQHNAKVNDNYDYRCYATVGQFYGWTGDFDGFVGRLDATMTRLGWAGTGPEHAVDRYREDIARLKKEGMSPASATRAAIDRVEELIYHRNGTSVTVEFAATESHAAAEDWIYRDNAAESRAARTQFLHDGALVVLIEGREFLRK